MPNSHTPSTASGTETPETDALQHKQTHRDWSHDKPISHPNQIAEWTLLARTLERRAIAAEAERDDYQARYRESLENGLRRLNAYNALKASAEEMHIELTRLRAAAEEGK